MAGQRTLTPYVEVRILRPQPNKHIKPADAGFMCFGEGGMRLSTEVRKNRRERFFATAGSPKGEAQGWAEQSSVPNGAW